MIGYATAVDWMASLVADMLFLHRFYRDPSPWRNLRRIFNSVRRDYPAAKRLGHVHRRPGSAHRCGGAALDAELFVDVLQVLLHGARADAQDRADLRIALSAATAQAPPSRAVSCRGVQTLINPGEVRAQDVEQRALAVGEVAARAVQHEAHQQAVAHVDRQRDGVVDADAAVVIVVERAAAKCSNGTESLMRCVPRPPW